MAIRRRGSTWVIDYYTPAGERIRKTFKLKKDAEAEHGKRKSLIAEGRYLDVKPGSTETLKTLCDKYAAAYENQKTFQDTKKTYLLNFKKHWGAGCLLTAIGPHDVLMYRNLLREKPVGKKTRTDASVNREVSCLHHLFAEAVTWGMLERSPFAGSLKLKENNSRLRFLTDEEIGLLLDACSDHLRPIVATAILTGMRRGEILGLKWDQVRNGFIYLTKTKTGDSRQIPVSDALEAVLREIRAKQHLTSEYVFLYQGQRIRDNFNSSFESACRRAGLVDFHFHDLRHTFASQVLLGGGTLKDIQEILGHRSMSMTLRYSHLTQEHKLAAVNLLGKLKAFSHGHNWSQKLRNGSSTP